MLSAKTANMMLASLYCERMDNKVVNTPAPMNSGKTTGTNVASPEECSVLSVNTLMSKIISTLIKNTTNEPAIANE